MPTVEQLCDVEWIRDEMERFGINMNPTYYDFEKFFAFDRYMDKLVASVV